MPSRTSRRKHLNPPGRARIPPPRTIRAHQEPPMLTSRRRRPHSSTPPPATYREPGARAGPPPRRAPRRREDPCDPAGELPNPDAEHPPRVPRPAVAPRAPQDAPLRRAAPGDVARAEREVGPAVADGAQQPRQVPGVVGEVGVHLEDLA